MEIKSGIRKKNTIDFTKFNIGKYQTILLLAIPAQVSNSEIYLA